MPARRSGDGTGDAPRTRRAVLAGAAVPALLSGCLEGHIGSARAGDDEAGADGKAGADDEAANDIGPPAQSLSVSAAEPVETATVSMAGDHGLRFAPQLVWVAVGGRVTWRNDDPEHGHDAVSLPGATPVNGERFSTGTLRRGESYERSFPVPGVYDYVCTPHASRMVGRVVVGEFDPDAEPALRSDRSELDGDEARAVLAALDDRMGPSDPVDCDCPD